MQLVLAKTLSSIKIEIRGSNWTILDASQSITFPTLADYTQ